MKNIFERTEEALSEVEISAIEHWSRRGEPTAPRFVLQLIATYKLAKKECEEKKKT